MVSIKFKLGKKEIDEKSQTTIKNNKIDIDIV